MSYIGGNVLCEYCNLFSEILTFSFEMLIVNNSSKLFRIKVQRSCCSFGLLSCFLCKVFIYFVEVIWLYFLCPSCQKCKFIYFCWLWMFLFSSFFRYLNRICAIFLSEISLSIFPLSMKLNVWLGFRCNLWIYWLLMVFGEVILGAR